MHNHQLASERTVILYEEDNMQSTEEEQEVPVDLTNPATTVNIRARERQQWQQPGRSTYYIPPCLLKAAVSATSPLNAVENDQEDNITDVITLEGPEPKSGKTSLLMDLAMHLALRTPCRCEIKSSNSTNEGSNVQQPFIKINHDVMGIGFDTNGHQHSRTATSSSNDCRCIAVLFLRVATATKSDRSTTAIRHYGNVSVNNDDDHFPLLCYHTSQSRIEKENEQFQGHGHGSNDVTNCSADYYTRTMNSLHRIKIYHVTDVSDAYKVLLTVQGWPLTEQPWGGIIIDDLDQMVHCRAGCSYFGGQNLPQYQQHNYDFNNNNNNNSNSSNFSSPSFPPPKQQQPMPLHTPSSFSTAETHPRMSKFCE